MERLAQVVFDKHVQYDIFFGWHCIPEFVASLAVLRPIDRVLLVTDENVDGLYAQQLNILLCEQGYIVLKYILNPGRKQKTLKSIENILKLLFENGADRNSIIINIGGGVVGDIGGLAAALYLRGIRYIHMPTTLLSQVDSSIGGKVGVNYLQHLNGVGHFYYPQAVWIDFSVLDSLPDAELIAGMAEVVKYGVILDVPLFAYLEQNVSRIQQRNPAAIEYLVKYCVNKKAVIVSADPAESNMFKLFTYGHEIGHALEVAINYQGLLHGEAVAIGMQGSAWLSQQLAFIQNRDLLIRQENLLKAIGLPTRVPDKILKDSSDVNLLAREIHQIIRRDKKRENDHSVWVLPIDIGRGICTDQLSEASIVQCIFYILGQG